MRRQRNNGGGGSSDVGGGVDTVLAPIGRGRGAGGHDVIGRSR